MSNKELIKISKLITIKNENKFKEYLNRPVESGFKAEITDKTVKVSADYTGFVYKHRREVIEKEQIMQAIKQLRRLAKANETKLKGINKLTKFINSNYCDYLNEVEDYNMKFDILKQSWSGYKVHEGYSDDEFLHNYLIPLRWELDKMTYRNTNLGMFESKYSRLKELIWTLDSELKNETNYHTTYTVLA